jgi:hypothetical protein
MVNKWVELLLLHITLKCSDVSLFAISDEDELDTIVVVVILYYIKMLLISLVICM